MAYEILYFSKSLGQTFLSLVPSQTISTSKKKKEWQAQGEIGTPKISPFDANFKFQFSQGREIESSHDLLQQFARKLNDNAVLQDIVVWGKSKLYTSLKNKYVFLEGKICWRITSDQEFWQGNLQIRNESNQSKTKIILLRFSPAFIPNTTTLQVYGFPVRSLVRWDTDQLHHDNGAHADCDVVAILGNGRN